MSYSIALQSTVQSAQQTATIVLNQCIKDSLKVYQFGVKVYQFGVKVCDILNSVHARQTYKMIINFGILVYSIVKILADAEVSRCTALEAPQTDETAPIEPQSPEVTQPVLEDSEAIAYAAAASSTPRAILVIKEKTSKRTRKQLLALAKEAKLENYSRMSTDQLDQLF
jgi:hypothetical protein